jgi:hypothetical protein
MQTTKLVSELTLEVVDALLAEAITEQPVN